MNREQIFELIDKERTHQDMKWGEQNHDSFVWMAILMEEVGEIANALIDSEKSYEDVLKETVQTAAVCVAFLECLDRNKK